jgi:hypothetical protein
MKLYVFTEGLSVRIRTIGVVLSLLFVVGKSNNFGYAPFVFSS